MLIIFVVVDGFMVHILVVFWGFMTGCEAVAMGQVVPLGRVARVPKVGVRCAALAADGPRDYHQPCQVLDRVSTGGVLPVALFTWT